LQGLFQIRPCAAIAAFTSIRTAAVLHRLAVVGRRLGMVDYSCRTEQRCAAYFVF
jgi:hypothetical protein